MFNTLFIAKSGKEFFGRVVERNKIFKSQIFNEENKLIFQSSKLEKPEQAQEKAKFFFSTIRNDI